MTYEQCDQPGCTAEAMILIGDMGGWCCLRHADVYARQLRSAISKMAHAVELATKELKG